jgi:putative endonuclease
MTANVDAPRSCHSGAARSAEPGTQEHRTIRMYAVYLLASRKHGTLYLGVTSNLPKRVYEHKAKLHPGFSARYGVDRLVWFEMHDEALSAITREKDIKKWRRDWKIRLIEEKNPDWSDLYPVISR